MNMNMILRPVTNADHEFLVDLHNDPEVLKNLTHPSPITVEQHMNWWEKTKNNPSQLRLIFEVDGKCAGFTKFYDIDLVNECCVLGADIHKSHRGKGLARLMWTLMLDKCFNELKLHRVGLTTAEYNVIGQRVYTGLGFKVEGKFTQSLFREGKFWDQYVMYMLKEDWKP